MKAIYGCELLMSEADTASLREDPRRALIGWGPKPNDAIAWPVGPDELETAQPNLGGIAKAESPAKKAYRTRRGGGTLPIELIPARKKDFNDAFLTTRKAEIREIHEDGSIHIEPWIATKYTSGSDPINNLRSKTRYRQGAWQELGIVELVVEVVE